MKKLNFKKITAVLGSVLLTGMTLGTAMAASYPAPFVEGGMGDVAIVYGSSALPSDATAAESIKTNLETSVTGATTVDGDSIDLEKSTDLFNIGQATNDFISTIDSGDLEVVLADGTFQDDGNDDYNYEQEIVMQPLMLKHFQDDDFNNDEPSLGLSLPKGTVIFNYTLDFTENADSSTTDWNEFEGANIEILGKEYYILSASNSTIGAETLTLLDSANSATVKEGETVTVATEDKTYTVSVNIIEDDDTASLVVDGEITNSIDENGVFQLDTGDYVGVKKVVDASYAGDESLVEFSIGSGKIELTSGSEVQLNGDDISDNLDHVLTAYIVNNSQSQLDKIVIEWKVDADMWLGFGTDSTTLEMPAFGNVQLGLGNFVTDVEEVTSVDPDGDTKYKLSTTVTDGDVNFNFLYTNETHIAGIGKDSNELLVTTGMDYINWTRNSKWFVASWEDGDEHESYVLEVSKIDGSASGNTTTIKSVAEGSDKEINLDVGDTDEIGEISFTLDWAEGDEEKYANITVSANTGSINLSRIVTAGGMRIQLPYESSTATTDGAINLTGTYNNSGTYTTDCGPLTWNMNFTEEDENDNVAKGENFYLTVGISSSKTTVSTIGREANAMSGGEDFETEDSSKMWKGYINSSLGTMTLFDKTGDEYEIDITYHDSEAYGEVFLAESGAVSSSGSLGDVVILDSEVSNYADSNLIVVGGSCVNTAAAALVGGSFCEADWTSNTGVGEGQFLIKSYATNDLTSEMALLVAGYEAADTTKAASYLTTQSVDTSESNVYSTSTSEVITA